MPARRRIAFSSRLATLSLLSEAAQERPLLCVIDDAQWLDRASAQALAFVARRLLAESVVMLFAARADDRCVRGSARAAHRGTRRCRRADAAGLGDPGRLDERVADQLVAEARGNPLALLELPRGLSPAQLAGGFGLPRALSLEGRIEQSFLQRLEALPDDTRRLLLVAAAEPLGDPALLWRAAERLGISGPALEPAESRRPDRGRRPGALSPSARALGGLPGGDAARTAAQVHRALAEATDAQVDPDRRAWHLAEATAGPDEDVAGELERAAGRAQARGGLAAAAAFLERAAALTPDPSGVRSGRWRRRRRSTRQARSTTPSRCSPPRRRAASTISSARACISCARRSRSPRRRGSDAPAAAAARPPASSRRSTRTGRAPPISRRSRRPGSPAGSPAARTSSR